MGDGRLMSHYEDPTGPDTFWETEPRREPPLLGYVVTNINGRDEYRLEGPYGAQVDFDYARHGRALLKRMEEARETMKNTGKFESLGNKVGALVDEKNAAYGNSFGKCADFLKTLYPDGIRPDQFTDMLCVVRIFDKMMRIATNKGAFDESPYKDIAGYALLGLEKDSPQSS